MAASGAAPGEPAGRDPDLLDLLPNPVLRFGPTGDLEHANRAWLELTRSTADAERGAGWLERVHGEDRAAWRDAIGAALAGGPGFLRTFRLAGGDGRERWLAASARPIAGPDGAIRGLLCSCLDIDGERRRDEHLRTLWRALEHSPASVLIADREGAIEYVNPRFSEMSGYSFAEVKGKNLRLLRSDATPPAVEEDLRRSIRAGSEWQGEVVNRRKDGTTYWEKVSISPVRDSSGVVTHFVAVTEDVSERRRAEKKLERTQAQLLEAQKMESVGRLAGGVAHDFNNLLSIIFGYSQLLLSPAARLPEASRTKVEQILKAAERAASLTRQLLAFSRRLVLQPRILDLGIIVSDLEKMLRRLIGEDVELSIVRPPALGRVEADPGQIENVILNLAVNARDAMPKGGKLVLELADVEVAKGASAPVAPGSWVTLSVRDTGTGMSPEVLPHVFEPFFTTKEQGRGTGLGLAVVYGIVQQSGGHIEVESVPGAGSTFRIWLPRAEGLTRRDEPAAGAASWPGRGETVLLAEDDAGVRELAADLLRSLNYQVLEAANGLAGLEVSRRHPGRIDLLFTDVIMPGMSGRELADRLAVERPGLRVLFTSGYTDDQLGRHGVIDPHLRFLPKPFTPNALARMVHEALRDPPYQGPRSE